MVKWDEISESEDPAVELLEFFGYKVVEPAMLDVERESRRDAIAVPRLRQAIRKLNPWISDDNLAKAVRAVTNVQAVSLIEANEKLHTVLTRGVTVKQDLGHGLESQDVHFIDFDDPYANDLAVCRQFKVRGTETAIIPDIVVLVNGIPFAVIECKSPNLGEKWTDEALDQLLRYQELTDKFRGRGAPRLFNTVQIVIGACGQDAIYGTVGTSRRYYLRWKDPYPLTPEEVERETGKVPRPQEILLYGLLTPSNLLDIARNFVTFEREKSTGRVIRKIPRYKQFMAVNRAIDRVRTAKRPEERGGVVWHTQGSGKSLTMLWLALKLRGDPVHENPTLVIVTDRTDLDKQISGTFIACGYPKPERAKSVKDLRRLLSGPAGRTITTTVQKFQEAGGVDRQGKPKKQLHPVLTEASNIFVMADEAHRTQYGSLAGNLRLALPNAAFFGFTGTPIDKKDRNTLEEFGPYIDCYTVEQAVADETVVPIFYEGRLPELRIVGQTLDRLFERVFADREAKEREAIKSKYATKNSIVLAPERIRTICLDLVDHYEKAIDPDGFKAQIVAVSREAAVSYKETLDELNGPMSAVIMSANHNDKKPLSDHHTTEGERRKRIEQFKDPEDPLKVLIVCDMLLTGFDAPVEQVMYLDAPLREHTLLQAIARVNRRFDGKGYGLVVDYWGVSEALQEALQIFSPEDVAGAMKPKSDELPRLEARHAAALRFFAAVKNKDDLNRCILVLEPEDVRAEFQVAFRRFSQSMDLMLPDPKVMHYVADLRWLGKIRQGAAARFRDQALDISDCAEKVRRLIEDAIRADGIEILVKKVSIFSGDFEKKMAALKGDDAKASEMEHAIRHEIHVRMEENPAFYRTLKERLEKIIEDYKERRITAARQLELFQEMTRDVGNPAATVASSGMSNRAHAIYGILGSSAGELRETAPEYGGQFDEPRKALAEILEEELADSLDVAGWSRKGDVQRIMRRSIKRQLIAARYGKEEAEASARRMIDMLKARSK